MTRPSLAGILIHTSPDRFEEMRSFYVDALGLEPRSDRPGFVNFEFGDQRLTIALHDSVSGTTREANRVMVNFATDALEVSYQRALDAGAPAIRPPSPEPWGGRVATIADPDGNSVQFLELP
jgi:predicted enzyme related to lactoylglutathione lyase